jgi:yeast amino acid transporter
LTAFEARDAKNLRWPSRTVPYVVVILYFMCAIGEALNVHWNDDRLPVIYNGVGNSTQQTVAPSKPPSDSVVILAIWDAGHSTIAAFINGCLIFSALSAGNTALYVASRTLFGWTKELEVSTRQNWFVNRIKFMAKTYHTVPAPAIGITAISFFWMPYLQLAKGYPVQEVSWSS